MLFNSKDLMVNVLPGHQIRLEGEEDPCRCPETSCAPDTPPAGGDEDAEENGCRGCPETSCAPDTPPAGDDEDAEEDGCKGCPETSCAPDTQPSGEEE